MENFRSAAGFSFRIRAISMNAERSKIQSTCALTDNKCSTQQHRERDAGQGHPVQIPFSVSLKGRIFPKLIFYCASLEGDSQDLVHVNRLATRRFMNKVTVPGCSLPLPGNGSLLLHQVAGLLKEKRKTRPLFPGTGFSSVPTLKELQIAVIRISRKVWTQVEQEVQGPGRIGNVDLAICVGIG